MEILSASPIAPPLAGRPTGRLLKPCAVELAVVVDQSLHLSPPTDRYSSRSRTSPHFPLTPIRIQTHLMTRTPTATTSIGPLI